MLFKLSLKNIQKSVKDYAIYFFTLILGVAIFYVFNAIDSQTAMMNVSKSAYEVIKLMTNMLSGVSVFVSFVLGFLIIYASRFLMKRRNKEFGVYLTLGMSKRKISTILLVETFLIGCISLAIGLIIGVIASQGMSLIVANLFEADMTSFQFTFSVEACIKTMIYFGIMYLIVMVFNTFSVSRCKLIDLLHANKKSETVKLKNPAVCIVVFILSVIALGYAYSMVSGDLSKLGSPNAIFIPIGIGCVTTFFIFWSLSGLLLKFVMSMKNTYYRGLNSFTLRQVSSKINTTVFSMTIICLMLFVTICVLSSGLFIKNSMNQNLNELAPVDMQIMRSVINVDDELDKEVYSNEQLQNTKLSIKEIYTNSGLNLDDYLESDYTFYNYQIPEFTFSKSLGKLFNQVSSTIYDSNENFMKISEYNRLAKMYGKETFELSDDEYLVIADYEATKKLRDEALKNAPTIEIDGKILKPKYLECKDGFIDIGGSHTNRGVYIIPDSLLKDEYKHTEYLIGNYKGTTKEQKLETEDKIFNENIINKVVPAVGSYAHNTRLDIAESAVGLGALVTFIALYLGIIFLISSAAILALKELSESTDNKERYDVLRKLGADDKLINKALFRQIGIFFGFPLILAIIHSIFGIRFSMTILETFGEKGFSLSIITTAIFIIVIYGGYFLLTYLCSKNIIKEK
ncbi:hypothetical protein P261_01274 [Lachnospiraceae bacterium TWA4]|nr:hypothetical protein P261_01274 [Lachnospiraceae bacterium TWA4]